MTCRIAIIGTSHVSALALAWKEMCNDWPDLSVTFFAAPGWNFRRLQLDPQKRFGILDETLFEPAEIRLLENSFGTVTLQLDAFDVVLHVGRDIYATDVASLLASFSIDDVRLQADAPPMSAAAYHGFVTMLAHQAVLPPLWHHWEKPALFVLPAPRFGETCAEAEGPMQHDWTRLLGQWAAGNPFAAQLTAYETLVQDRYAKAGIVLLSPPTTVLGESGLTQAHFTRDARQLTNTPYSSVDHKHMNSDYGRIVLTHALQKICPDLGQATAAQNQTEPQPSP